MTAPISNHYDPHAKRPKLAVEQVWLYQPRHESDWHYDHHPHITFYQGRFHAIWSNGRMNEDDVGQRVMMATSTDFAHWTEPALLLDSRPGEHSDVVLTAAGFHQHAGTLVAYVGQFEYRPDYILNQVPPTGQDLGHMGTKLLALSTTDGDSWSDVMDLGVPIVPNHGPQPTASGRLILSGNVMFPYTDDPTGLEDWHPTGIYPARLADKIFDDSHGHKWLWERTDWPTNLCEGAFYQTDDGLLHMLLRSREKRLWLTQSRDDGESWSEPVPTHFTDNNTKFHFGRLRDGQFYYVGCPDPVGKRNPLVLSLSEDGIHFRRHFILADSDYSRRFPGMHKSGVYGYPHTLIHDGYLYVIVSICKEQVMAMRTSIDTIFSYPTI